MKKYCLLIGIVFSLMSLSGQNTSKCRVGEVTSYNIICDQSDLSNYENLYLLKYEFSSFLDDGNMDYKLAYSDSIVSKNDSEYFFPTYEKRNLSKHYLAACSYTMSHENSIPSPLYVARCRGLRIEFLGNIFKLNDYEVCVTDFTLLYYFYALWINNKQP